MVSEEKATKQKDKQSEKSLNNDIAAHNVLRDGTTFRRY
jgi:hypothetical protein